MDPAFQKFSPGLQKQVFAAETAGSETKALTEMLDRFSDPARMRQQLQLASEFDERRLKEAGKYKLLFDLPAQITAAYAIPGAIEAQGGVNVANIMTSAGATIPNLVDYQRGSYNYTPNRYF
jgi:hypothetical protein